MGVVSHSIIFPFCTFTNQPRITSPTTSLRLSSPRWFIRCATATDISSEKIIARRSANYRPSNWSNNFVQSLTSQYMGEPYITRIDKVKGEVKKMIEQATNSLDQLEIIDTLQRLGVAYHFEDEIERALKSIHNTNINNHTISNQNDIHPHLLYATALEFRLLRQQGFNATQEVFNNFKDEEGNFKACLGEDLKGLLYLYEATFLNIHGDTILEEARDFAFKNLQILYLRNRNNITTTNTSSEDEYLLVMAEHALELPLHWRMQRVEARWFIDAYENNPCMNPILLEFAKLDFNMVQAIHQDDLKHASSWWKKTDLGEKLDFVRARPMEGFLWTVGGVFEPQFGYFRRILSRVGALVTVIDDIYDVYGTLDELEIFTDAVVRWDINAMDQLPNYMKICFLALYNTINEMAFDILKDQGLHIIPYLKKEWGTLCKTYLLEAKWYANGYTPTLEEYLNNAYISISAPLLLVHAYFTATNQITEQVSESLKDYPDIIRYSSLITRLADDLGTSSHEQKRGDNPKSIQCYMHENGGTEEEARKHIHNLISEAWKKINEEQITNNMFSRTLMRMTMNLARMSQCMYQHGDGFGAQNKETKKRVISLLVDPIPLQDH